MTHDDLMTILLSDDALQRIDSDVIEATAARLIRYRELIERARSFLEPHWLDERQLLVDIREALK
jgi:hypothetical protein